MPQFVKFAFTPAGLPHAALAIAACRAGGIGVVNGELVPDADRIRHALDTVAAHVASPYGVKLDAVSEDLALALIAHARRGLCWVVVDAEQAAAHLQLIDALRGAGTQVIAEVRTPQWPGAPLE